MPDMFDITNLEVPADLGGLSSGVEQQSLLSLLASLIASSSGGGSVARDPLAFPPVNARHFYINEKLATYETSYGFMNAEGVLVLARLVVADGEVASVRDIGFFTETPSAVEVNDITPGLLLNGSPLGDGLDKMHARPGSGPPTYLNVDYYRWDPLLEVTGPAVLELIVTDPSQLGFQTAGTLRGWIYRADGEAPAPAAPSVFVGLGGLGPAGDYDGVTVGIAPYFVGENTAAPFEMLMNSKANIGVKVDTSESVDTVITFNAAVTKVTVTSYDVGNVPDPSAAFIIAYDASDVELGRTHFEFNGLTKRDTRSVEFAGIRKVVLQHAATDWVAYYGLSFEH